MSLPRFKNSYEMFSYFENEATSEEINHAVTALNAHDDLLRACQVLVEEAEVSLNHADDKDDIQKIKFALHLGGNAIAEAQGGSR